MAAKPEPKVAANQTVHTPPAALTPQAHTKPMEFPRSSLADGGSPLATQTPEALALKAKVGWCGTVWHGVHAARKVNLTPELILQFNEIAKPAGYGQDWQPPKGEKASVAAEATFAPAKAGVSCYDRTWLYRC